MKLQTKVKEDVLAKVEQHSISSIQLWFTDILGVTKSIAITPRQLEDAIDYGKNFDGSSIEGYRDIEESDMVAMPDTSTFQLLPFNTGTTRMICDVQTPEGVPYEGDPRYILKLQVERAAKLGFTSYMGPELEYFYFKDNKSLEGIDEGGYFFLQPTDLHANLRQQTVAALEAMDVPVEAEHHEVAPSQHEIDLRYDSVLQMADKTQTYKFLVKEVAKHNGVYATFMPKPLFGKNGSGMHVHQSLFTKVGNAFFEKSDPHFLSDTGKSYIAGLLRHAREYCSITNSSINSYKRLVPGYEAPVYIAWSRANRSAMIRIPNIRPGDPNATRAELRCPDPAGNPYLQFAVMLGAGLEGIEQRYELPTPVNTNMFNLNEEELARHKVSTLPGSLNEAVAATAQSTLMRSVLRPHIFSRYIDIKRKEWDKYRMQVTDYEVQKLLPNL